MCNLYSLTKTREELVNLFGVVHEAHRGDFASSIYPDMPAPVVRLDEQGGRELDVMRWGFPPPPKAEFRCLVPATSFCEWSDSRPKTQHWFEVTSADTAPVFAFAGIWRPWSGTRRGETGEHRLFSFLTCESNDIVRPVHAKAMPVILADEDAWDQWLTGSTEEALELQRPCPAGRLAVKAAAS